MTIGIRRMSARINNQSYPETSKYQEMRGTVEEICIIHMIDMIWYSMIWYDMKGRIKHILDSDVFKSEPEAHPYWPA